MNNIILAFIVSTLAGLSTLIGACVIFINKKKTNNFILCSIAFAAGVMIFLSLFDLIPEGISFFNKLFFPIPSILLCFIFIVVGILISIFIDKYVSYDISNSLYRVGIVSMIGIIIHNIPEDCSCYVSHRNVVLV